MGAGLRRCQLETTSGRHPPRSAGQRFLCTWGNTSQPSPRMATTATSIPAVAPPLLPSSAGGSASTPETAGSVVVGAGSAVNILGPARPRLHQDEADQRCQKSRPQPPPDHGRTVVAARRNHQRLGGRVQGTESPGLGRES